VGSRPTDPVTEGQRALESSRAEGIVTLADQDFFVGLVLLYYSVQRDYPTPIVCFDAGLTETQRAWARQHMPTCTICPIPDTEDVRKVREALSGTSENETEEWLLWICPLLIATSPFRRTLWLDCDLVVLSGLGRLFERLDDGPVFTPENHAPELTSNAPELYAHLKIEGLRDGEGPLVNGGVSGWDLVRDSELLSAYRHPVMTATHDAAVRESIRWHDQGALIWAIQSAHAEDRVVEGLEWNLCAKWTDSPTQTYRADAALLDNLRNDYPSAHIVHWNGFSLPDKIAFRLGSETEALDAFERLLPGSPRASSGSQRPRIHLVSNVGCKANPLLIESFLQHYARLGVDQFLIVLHGQEGDPRLEQARAMLDAHGIQPVLESPIFSTPLKLERLRDIFESHVAPEDWVLSADVDELQVYPEELPTLLQRCDQAGYSFVRGGFVDRVAPDGQLPPMAPDRSLWEQFPYGASVTAQVTGGWPLKVCALKGWRRLAEGGSHTLDYGADGFRNYTATHRDPYGYPTPVEIHHFKWEAGLLQRTQEKTAGVGGDREAIDGAEFMHEYHALLDHLEHNGRLVVDDLRLIGEPQLHYVREAASR
jgi:hypothetical protein